MTVRVGADLSVDDGLLRGWGSEMPFVRIPEIPKRKLRSTSRYPLCLPESCGVRGNG
jgi:hypothetical protein